MPARKKFLLQIVSLMIILMLLVSCAPQADKAAPAEDAAAAEEAAPAEEEAAEVVEEEAVAEEEVAEEAGEAVPVVTWFQYDQNNDDPASDERVGNEYLAKSIPLFDEDFAGQYTWVNVPKAFDKMSGELVAAVQAGGEVPDVFELNSDSVNTFYRNGTVQDLRPWAEQQEWYADVDQSALTACTGPDGGLYCIPISLRPQVVYVWTERFPDGYPDTVDEFMEQAEALKAEGLYAITYFGSTDKGGDGITRAMYTILSSFGGSLDDGDGNMQLNTPENKAAIEFMREIVAAGYVPEIAFAGGFQEEEPFKDSTAGSLPTGLNGYRYVNPLTAPDGTEYAKGNEEDFLDALAAGDIYLSSFFSVEGAEPGCDIKASGLTIPVGATNVEGAHAFINWIMSPEQNPAYMIGPGGGFPALKTTQSDENFQTPYWIQAAEAVGASSCSPWQGSLDRPEEAKALAMQAIYKLVKEDPTADIEEVLTATETEYNSGN